VKGGLELRPWRRLFLVPSFVWYSRTKIRPDALEPDLAASGLDPFFVLDAAALWEGDHFQIWVRAQNILDNRYYRPGGRSASRRRRRCPRRDHGPGGVRVLY
jgi:hypothetical protein